MFKLPAYDPTAIAVLGFGILAALSLLFIFQLSATCSLGRQAFPSVKI